MKIRWIVLWADGLLLLALPLILAALVSGGTVREKQRFELPVLPVSPRTDQASPVPVELVRNNLFHPLRGASPPVEAEKTPEKKSGHPPAAGKFRVTGIFSFGDRRGAVITGMSPVVGTAGEKRRSLKRLFRPGEELEGGYVVRKIDADQVVLVRENEKLILPLHEKQEKKP